MYGSDEVTADNALGVKDFGTAGKKLSSPVELTMKVLQMLTTVL